MLALFTMALSVQSAVSKTSQYAYSYAGGGAMLGALALYYFKGDSTLFKWLSLLLGGGGLVALCYGNSNGDTSSSVPVVPVAPVPPPAANIDPLALRKKHLEKCRTLSLEDLIKSLKDGQNDNDLRLAAANTMIMRDKIKELQEVITETGFGAGAIEAQNEDVLEEIKGMLVPVTSWSRFFTMGAW